MRFRLLTLLFAICTLKLLACFQVSSPPPKRSYSVKQTVIKIAGNHHLSYSSGQKNAPIKKRKKKPKGLKQLFLQIEIPDFNQFFSYAPQALNTATGRVSTSCANYYFKRGPPAV